HIVGFFDAAGGTFRLCGRGNYLLLSDESPWMPLFFDVNCRGNMFYRKPLTVILTALCIGFSAAGISAQFTNRVRITEAATNSSSGRRTTPRPPVAHIRRVAPTVVRETKVVPVTVLTVTTEPGAMVSFAKPGSIAKRDIPADQNGFAIFNDIAPGIYTVTAT